MALAAPRSLKEPMGCRFSSLSQISAGAPSAFRRTSGVRSVTPARRSRAARTSSIVGADRDRMGPETIAISGRGWPLSESSRKPARQKKPYGGGRDVPSPPTIPTAGPGRRDVSEAGTLIRSTTTHGGGGTLVSRNRAHGGALPPRGSFLLFGGGGPAAETPRRYGTAEGV